MPRPAEQNPHVRIDVGNGCRYDHTPNQAQATSSKGLCGLDKRGINLAHCIANHQHLLEKRSDDNNGDLGTVVDSENGHTQGAKGGCGRVAEKFNERFLETSEEAVSSAENAQGHAQ